MQAHCPVALLPFALLSSSTAPSKKPSKTAGRRRCSAGQMKSAWRAYGQEPAHCSRLGLSSIRRGGALPYKELGQHETCTRTQSPSRTHLPALARLSISYHLVPRALHALWVPLAAAKCCWPEHALRHLSKPWLSLSQRQGGRRKPRFNCRGRDSQCRC